MTRPRIVLVLAVLAAAAGCRATPMTGPDPTGPPPTAATTAATTAPAAPTPDPTVTASSTSAPDASDPAPAARPPATAASRVAPPGSALARFARGRAARPGPVGARLVALHPTAALGRRLGALVIDPYTGAVLAERGHDVPVAPASTTKLLTATAALDVFGAGHRFRTRVVLVSAGDGIAHLVLVGGGDPSLTSVAAGTPAAQAAVSPTSVVDPARLPQLAALTARAVRSRGLRAADVDVDDTLFTGPKVSRAWLPGDVEEGYVGPVDALTVDNGRVRPGVGTRSRDPAVAAGTDFAALLRAAGLAVGPTVHHAVSPAGARTIAAVSSPPLAALLRRMLQASDNDYAEVLARQVAVGSGLPGSFGGAVTAVHRRLAALGIDQSGVRLYDGSGLSHVDRIPPSVLAGVLRLDVRTPRLSAVIAGLPVAGRSGSLQYRMGGATGPAAGRVLAKTGTLTGVHDLAGIVLTRANGPLIFVFMAGASADDLVAEDDLDDAAVSLAGCGCAR